MTIITMYGLHIEEPENILINVEEYLDEEGNLDTDEFTIDHSGINFDRDDLQDKYISHEYINEYPLMGDNCKGIVLPLALPIRLGSNYTKDIVIDILKVTYGDYLPEDLDLESKVVYAEVYQI